MPTATHTTSQGSAVCNRDARPRSKRVAVLHPRKLPLSCNSGRVQKDFPSWAAAMTAGDFSSASRINRAAGRHWPSAHHLWQSQASPFPHLRVRCLHGLGDAVQMLRFAPQLATLAPRTTFEVPTPLLPLAPFFRGVTHLAGPQPPCLATPPCPQMELMEALPLLVSTLADVASPGPYLTLPSGAVHNIAREMGVTRKRRIGLVWAGGLFDPDRFLAPQHFVPLLSLRNTEFWNLQGGLAADAASGLNLCRMNGIGKRDLLAFASVIQNMDLVITADTLAAHIAGALGVPAFVLLKQQADWRWLADRSDSPWYPSLRLFRQPSPGAWEPVIAGVRQALEQVSCH